MNDSQKAQIIVITEKLRLIESELFRLASKYGVSTIGELDKLIIQGKLSEDAVGDDLFVFDQLITEKDKIEKELVQLKIKKADIWKNLQHLLGLPKLSSRI